MTEGRKELTTLSNPITMLSGNPFVLVSDGSSGTVGGAPLVPPSLPAINGIVHESSSLYTN